MITLAYALSRSCIRNLTNDILKQGNAGSLPADAGTGSGASSTCQREIWLRLCIQYQGALLGPYTDNSVCLYQLNKSSDWKRIGGGYVLRWSRNERATSKKGLCHSTEELYIEVL
jgi:hypothetical protein